MNLTRSYPLNQMAVGDSFVVSERFQHCRVAASEYARRHGVVFSCRVEYVDDIKYLRVHRCENNQAMIDQRGARGKRRIVTAVNEPSQHEFGTWLSSFGVGSSYVMPSMYSHLFAAMVAWCELHTIKSTQSFTTQRIDNTLVIKRLK